MTTEEIERLRFVERTFRPYDPFEPINKKQVVKCTCPEEWFPQDRREQLRDMPHNFHGVLAHHDSCQKTKTT